MDTIKKILSGFIVFGLLGLVIGLNFVDVGKLLDGGSLQSALLGASAETLPTELPAKTIGEETTEAASPADAAAEATPETPPTPATIVEAAPCAPAEEGAPYICSLSPEVANPGSIVTIKGGNFGSTIYANEVKIGGLTAPVLSTGVENSAVTSLKIKIPSALPKGTPLEATVRVGYKQGIKADALYIGTRPSDQQKKFDGNPVITRFEPAYGLPGTEVYLYGENFGKSVASNLVYFKSTSGTMRAATTEFVVRDGEQALKVTVPQTAITGPITLMQGKVTAETITPFTVSGTAPVSNTESAPIIAALSTITPRVGDSVMILGKGLTGEHRAKNETIVRLGAVPLPIQSIGRDAENNDVIIVTIPGGAKTGFLTVEAKGATAVFAQSVTVDLTIDTTKSGTPPVVVSQESRVLPKNPTIAGTAALSFFAYVTDSDSGDDIETVTIDLSPLGMDPAYPLSAGEKRGRGYVFEVRDLPLTQAPEPYTPYELVITATDRSGEKGAGTVTVCFDGCTAPAEAQAAGSTTLYSAATLPTVAAVTVQSEEAALIVSWTPISEAIDGYYLYYGTNPQALIHRVELSPEFTTHALRAVPSIQYYFAVSVVSGGQEGPVSLAATGSAYTPAEAALLRQRPITPQQPGIIGVQYPY